MCIFAGAELRVRVSKTSIFARIVDPGVQALAYSMTVDTPAETAMVLPVPVAAGTGENAVRFVALDRHPRMFIELAEMFPLPRSRSRALNQSRGNPAPTLEVHKVGAFVASYVPSPADFGRLDARFRVSDELFESAPQYADHGFAVFQLEAGAHTVHPMAFTFPTRAPDQLFFPTVHVHDGHFHSHAKFDHGLYYQHPRCTKPGEPFGSDEVSVNRCVRYEGLAAFGEPVVRRIVTGVQPNADTWIAAT